MSELRCLTVWQPYASQIIGGQKLIEHRAWNTAYRGPLLIHAGRRVNPKRNGHPLGVILGRVDLMEVQAGRIFGKWRWVLSGAIALPEPITYRGRQGLFRLDELTEHRVLVQLRGL